MSESQFRHIFNPGGLAAFSISTSLASTCSGHHSCVLLPSSYGECGQLRLLGYFLKNFYHKSVHVSMEFIEFWVAGKARLRLKERRNSSVFF